MRGDRINLVRELVDFSLKQVRRIEVKFDPFHANAAAVREFYQEATARRRLKASPEIVTRAQVVCDNSDPLVTLQFANNHKLVLNAKHLQAAHIVKLIKKFEQVNKDDSVDD